MQNLDCTQLGTSCSGVSHEVTSYVLTNYNDTDQAQSVLQASKSLSIVQTLTNSSTPPTRQNLVDAYRNITKSVECMSLNMPDSYTNDFQKLSQVQFTSTD